MPIDGAIKITSDHTAGWLIDGTAETCLINREGIPVVGFTDFGHVTVIFGVGQAFDIPGDMQFGVIPRACGNSHINVGGLVG